MKSLTVNGEKQIPDAEGNVSLTIDKLEVDESLNAESTNRSRTVPWRPSWARWKPVPSSTAPPN